MTERASDERLAEYDRGRRDVLNAILALNPKAAMKLHVINGGTEETFANHQGKLPFDVVFWVCEVADQLGIEPRDDILTKVLNRITLAQSALPTPCPRR